MIRNLYYNCCPLDYSEKEWRDNIKMLCRYGDIFNGRRIVVIRVGENMSPAEEVKAAFHHHGLSDVEYRLRPNDPELHEVAHFIETLESLKSLRHDEITFYAHTKGVRRRRLADLTGPSIRQWRNRMYHECLHDPGRVDAVMSRYKTAGCFFLKGGRKRSNWMWCGTFFWFNHKALFSQADWRFLGPGLDRFSIEDYPGLHFKEKDAFTFHGRETTAGALYSAAAGVFECPACGKVFNYPLNNKKRARCCKNRVTLLYIPELG